MSDDKTQKTDRYRDADPDPHKAQVFGAARLDEVCHKDADNERGLKTFAKTDKEVGEHDGPREGRVLGMPYKLNVRAT